jgi:outer membrane protein TolC
MRSSIFWSTGRCTRISTSKWRPPGSAKPGRRNGPPAPVPRPRWRRKLPSPASGSAKTPSPLPPGPGSGSGAGIFGLPGEEFTTWRAGFDASWEIDLFGRNRREVEAAKARTGAAIWNRRDAQGSVAAEVAGAYFRLRTLQGRIAIAQAELSRQQRFEQLVAARARGGLVTGQDLEQQRSERAAAAAEIPQLAAQAKAETHALAILTGQVPEALGAELATSASIPTAPVVPAGVPSDLLRRRPDIRAAERELAASHRRHRRCRGRPLSALLADCGTCAGQHCAGLVPRMG